MMNEDEVRSLPLMVSVSKAAEAMGITKYHALDLVKAGDFPLPLTRVGKRMKVRKADLARFLGLNCWCHPDDTPQPVTVDELNFFRADKRTLDFADHLVTVRLKSGKTKRIDPNKTYRYKGQHVLGQVIINELGVADDA